MRKLNKGRKLSMRKGPRGQLLKSLANNFFVYEKIQTTEAKAKELRPVVEKMITRAMQDTVANRRLIAKNLALKTLKKVFSEIAPMYKSRKGGYTRIIKLGQRDSDGARMAIIELVK